MGKFQIYSIPSDDRLPGKTLLYDRIESARGGDSAAMLEVNSVIASMKGIASIVRLNQDRKSLSELKKKGKATKGAKAKRRARLVDQLQAHEAAVRNDPSAQDGIEGEQAVVAWYQFWALRHSPTILRWCGNRPHVRQQAELVLADLILKLLRKVGWMGAIEAPILPVLISYLERALFHEMCSARRTGKLDAHAVPLERAGDLSAGQLADEEDEMSRWVLGSKLVGAVPAFLNGLFKKRKSWLYPAELDILYGLDKSTIAALLNVKKVDATFTGLSKKIAGRLAEDDRLDFELEMTRLTKWVDAQPARSKGVNAGPATVREWLAEAHRARRRRAIDELAGEPCVSSALQARLPAALNRAGASQLAALDRAIHQLGTCCDRHRSLRQDLGLETLSRYVGQTNLVRLRDLGRKLFLELVGDIELRQATACNLHAFVFSCHGRCSYRHGSCRHLLLAA